MHVNARQFALSFQYAFARESSLVQFGEIAQFRAMMRAFAVLSPQFYLEEYHGSKRQVYFNTSQPWLRALARCELCDVLFVVFSKDGGLRVKMTLLQAKLSRSLHCTDLASFNGLIEPQMFKANFEQWDLLSARPTISPTTVFSPPPDLLSSAVAPSVGSFGIFHRTAAGKVDFFYASADCLSPNGTPTGPKGQLRTHHGFPVRRSFAGFGDAAYCATSLFFAQSLYSLEIGTPVVITQPNGTRSDFPPIAKWLKSVLTAHIRTADADSPVARSLLDELQDVGEDPDPNDTFPNLLVLRSELSVDPDFSERDDS